MTTRKDGDGEWPTENSRAKLPLVGTMPSDDLLCVYVRNTLFYIFTPVSLSLEIASLVCPLSLSLSLAYIHARTLLIRVSSFETGTNENHPIN